VEAGSKLVQDAGSTMGEIVASVQRVSDIIAEISAASSEQSQGIGQVNASVSQLDQMTQQNAALVEESAAAADSLRQQSERLVGVVHRFVLGNEVQGHTVSQPARTVSATSAPRPMAKPALARPAATPAVKPAPAPQPIQAAAEEWEAF
jgi:methyl-accepting chemotaxis protein